MKTKSRKRKTTIKTFRQHGLSKTPEYSSWRGMVERCENQNHKAWPDYGGRGVTVCDRWRLSFEAFLADMGPRPDGCSIERREGAKGYEPDNCRWATRAEQNRNKRNNRRITAFGKTQLLAEWAEQTGIPVPTIVTRLDRDGWPAEKALTPGRHAKKNTRWIEFRGERRNIGEWAQLFGISRPGLADRIARHGVERAMEMSAI